MISRLQHLHSRSFVHRDMKPDNFLIGLGPRANIVNMIDFGLAKKYRDPKTKVHIPIREGKSFTGTARYASINTHLGTEQSRRDDLESLGYILMYFLRGSLPWQGLKAATKKMRYEKISQVKTSTPLEVLCKGFPQEFQFYFEYCRAIKFDEKPNYDHIRKMFHKLFQSEGFEWDYMYDWTIKKVQESGGELVRNTLPKRQPRTKTVINRSFVKQDQRPTTKNSSTLPDSLAEVSVAQLC